MREEQNTLQLFKGTTFTAAEVQTVFLVSQKYPELPQHPRDPLFHNTHLVFRAVLPARLQGMVPGLRGPPASPALSRVPAPRGNDSVLT